LSQSGPIGLTARPGSLNDMMTIPDADGGPSEDEDEGEDEDTGEDEDV